MEYDTLCARLTKNQSQDLGTLDPIKLGDHYNDCDDNMNRIEFRYFTTFTPGKLAQAVRDRLHALGWDSRTRFFGGHNDIHHIYIRKLED